MSVIYVQLHVEDGNNYDEQTNIWYILEGSSIFIFTFLFFDLRTLKSLTFGRHEA